MDALPTEKGLELTTSMKDASTASMKNAATSNVVAKVGAKATPGLDKAPTKTFENREPTEKILQPVSIELKGDKLANFVVEVIGQNVSTRIKPYA
jgi:hypothetical protein